ncbi:FAD-binding protein [Lapillicoccus sp.]|uniref:FAD-binding protein n=1 Tax=Lapillicoccus sp. TaxID=1909287 RepID=UPI0039836E99
MAIDIDTSRIRAMVIQELTAEPIMRCDVAVIGGGAAGLSAGLVLGRARRSVVVIDAGQPRNASAGGVHGFLLCDGISPAELLATGRREIQHYGGQVVAGEAPGVERIVDGFDVSLADGTVVARGELTVAPRFVARSGVLTTLGLDPSPHPLGVGEFVAADAFGLTDVPGVWVAGNVTNLQAQVVTAAAEGVTAAAALNADLIAEDTRRAVTAHRDRLAATPELVVASGS